MKIVQLVNTMSVTDGGPARNAFELAQALNQLPGTSGSLFWFQGIYADSLLASENNPQHQAFTDAMRKLSTKANAVTRTSSICDFYRQIRSADIVIIHGYFLLWVPVMSVWLTLLRTPFVITPHGSLTHRQQGISVTKKRIFESLVGWFVRNRVASFVTGSRVEAVELLDKFPNAVVAVAGVGTDLPEVFKSEDLVNSPVQLLSMSRIAEKKRIDISIGALAILVERGSNATLTVAGVGSTPLTRRLRELADELSVSDRVNFVGQVMGPQKSELFCSSDVFLLPSDDENFGIGFAEAMAHGLPSVVSANVAAATNMPTEAGTLLVAPTPETVADAILQVIDAGKHKDGQKVAREFAESEFAWPAVAGKWLNILATHRK